MAIHLEREPNIEILRQVALVQERQIEKLVRRVHELSMELARLRGRDVSKVQQELDILQEILAQHERAAVSGHASERRSRSDEGPADPAPQRGHGRRAQPELAIEDVVHVLPETERDCPVCRGEMTPMQDQYEESEEITVIPRRPIVLRHKRQKYRCTCNASIVTAPGPVKLQPGSRYSVQFAVEVAAGKYLDHLPLERQVRMFRREGLDVESQTLWDQLDVLARLLEPTYAALRQRLLESPVVHADETGWRRLDQEGKRWVVWGVSSHDVALYVIADSRSKNAAEEVLKDFKGIMVADGFGVYEAIATPGRGIRLANCWAHARRKFVEIEANFPAECGEILDLIGELYGVEREVPRARAPATLEDPPDVLALRQTLRETRSRAITTRIRDWAYSQRALPGSELAKAIRYLLDRWYGLTAFLDDPRIPLDNNAAERSLRGVVLGRKNHYGSRSKRGTQVAALFYTLFESAKLCGVEPKAYVLQAANAALRDPDSATLPHALIP